MNAVDPKRLAAARETIGSAVVAHVRSLQSATNEPYSRIAAAEWLIWAETERRRVMPKGRGRPRKEAIR
ncbi:MAG: hypothetical protein V7609_2132 [Verrucomicrobiota bacterium]